MNAKALAKAIQNLRSKTPAKKSQNNSYINRGKSAPKNRGTKEFTEDYYA